MWCRGCHEEVPGVALPDQPALVICPRCHVDLGRPSNPEQEHQDVNCDPAEQDEPLDDANAGDVGNAIRLDAVDRSALSLKRIEAALDRSADRGERNRRRLQSVVQLLSSDSIRGDYECGECDDSPPALPESSRVFSDVVSLRMEDEHANLSKLTGRTTSAGQTLDRAIGLATGDGSRGPAESIHGTPDRRVRVDAATAAVRDEVVARVQPIPAAAAVGAIAFAVLISGIVIGVHRLAIGDFSMAASLGLPLAGVGLGSLWAAMFLRRS